MQIYSLENKAVEKINRGGKNRDVFFGVVFFFGKKLREGKARACLLYGMVAKIFWNIC
jgi:hypothetical protein